MSDKPIACPSVGASRSLAWGPFGGFQVLAEAVFISLRPPARRLAVIPFILNVILLLTLIWAASHWWPTTWAASTGGEGFAGWSAAFLHNLRTIITAFGARLGTIIAAVAASLLLTEPICGLLGITDRLVFTQRDALFPGAPWSPPSFMVSLRRSALAVGIGIFLQVPVLFASVCALGFGFIPFLGQLIALPFGLLAWTFAGTLQAWNLLDYPFSLAGFRIRDRLAWIARNFPTVLGFGVPLAFCSLFLMPVVLPIGVIAASRLFLKIEQSSSAR